MPSVCYPPFSILVDGTIARTTPVNAASNSAMSICRAADRRIIDMDAPPAIEPFQNHEMIEIPVNDAWHGELVESRGAPCGIP